jgi:hypothetical protein
LTYCGREAAIGMPGDIKAEKRELIIDQEKF